MSYDEFKHYTPRHFRIYVEAFVKNKLQEIDRANYRAGKICATVVNLVSKRKRQPKDFFKPIYKEEKKVMDVNQMAEMFKIITIARGGTVNG